MQLTAIDHSNSCRNDLTRQILRVMKLTAVFLFVVSLHVAARSDGQMISLSIRKQPLESVFSEIKKQTGYNFIYGKELASKVDLVTISVQNVSIETVLDLLFQNQPLAYQISEKYIIISPKQLRKPQSADGQFSETDLPPPVDISGRVVDADGRPLVGASVKVKNSIQGVTTGENGIFILRQVDINSTVEISYIGYESRTIKIKDNSSVTVTLPLEIQNLKSITVNKGYYSTSKQLNTGDVSTVTSAEIEKQPVNNPLLALQGRVTGMEITQSTGVPGGGLNVQIRGINSIGSGTNPLFIVDGVPYPIQTMRGYFFQSQLLADIGSGSPFAYLNPADIESIDVLKDADATAIYGSRGANGVVLITTKKGKPGKTKFEVNVQSGWSKVTRVMKMMNTQQYLEMRREAFKNDNATPNPNVDFDLTLWDTTRYTDWMKELIGNTARYNDAQVNFSGGNSNTQFIFGGTFHKETTVFPGDYYDKKGSVHLNINHASANNKLKASMTVNYQLDDNHLSPSTWPTYAMLLPPNAPSLYNPDGSLNWAPGPTGATTWPRQVNPLAMTTSHYNMKNYTLVANTSLSYQIARGLQLSGSFGFNSIHSDQSAWIPNTSYDPFVVSRIERYSDFSNSDIQTWIIEPQLSYTKTISKGVFSALAGMTIQKNHSTALSLQGTGYSNDLAMQDLKSATRVVVGISDNLYYRYNAGYARLGYTWLDKYLINLTGRRDGSSRFSPANRFHNFGSAAVGWIFSKEDFVQRSLPFLSFGKLRMSYGSTGNDQVGDYSYLDLYTSQTYNSNPYQGIIGLMPGLPVITDLQWEETRKMEAGLELGFLNDKIVVQGAYYRNRSSNQIVGYQLPGTTGFTGISKNLDALVQNSGLEGELKTTNISTKNFKWTTGFNITANRNKLVSIGNGVYEGLKKLVGHSLRTQQLYDFVDVDPFTGVYQFQDNKGQLTTNPDPVKDKTIFMDQTTKFYGGFQNTFSYKGIELDVLFQFVDKPHAEQYRFNYIPGIFSAALSNGSNQPVQVLNRWQKPGDVQPYQHYSQKYDLAFSYRNTLESDLIYGNGSYIRLKNISLSWQLPDKWKQRVHMQSAKLFAHAQNLFTITNYLGNDPESQSSTLAIPPLKTLTVGVQMSF
jgi:TonB-linked SusC/RagA family outer membrane protein